MALIGQIIGGRYEIRKTVDSGGMSAIYLARDLHIGKVWAVKEIPKMINGRENTLFIRAAMNEVRIIKSLDHPSVIRIVDLVEEGNNLYIIEDFINGISLKDYTEKNGIVREEELICWGIQLCEVMAYLHSRNPSVIYRDLKPENLMLVNDRNLILVDFGIARLYKPGKKRDTEYLGTEKYAAPEQFKESGSQTDCRTDIYGIGSTLKYLSAYCRNLSPDLKGIINKCMEEKPDNRYGSASELLNILLESREKQKTVRRKGISLIRILLAVLAVIIMVVSFGAVMLRNNAKKRFIDSAMKMVNEFKADGVFSEIEEERLLNEIVPVLGELKEKAGFEELAYNIGKLYWFYYEYGPDEKTGMIASIPWFEWSADYGGRDSVYLKIAEFYRDISCRIIESEDTGCYTEFFTQLSDLEKKVSKSTDSEYSRLTVYKLVFESLETYVRKFVIDGISENDVRSLFNQTLEDLERTECSSLLTDEMKTVTENRIESARISIDKAYASQGVNNEKDK